VEGWIATHRIYGQTGWNIKRMESYEILYCPEYVNDGSEHRKPALMLPDRENKIKD